MSSTHPHYRPAETPGKIKTWVFCLGLASGLALFYAIWTLWIKPPANSRGGPLNQINEMHLTPSAPSQDRTGDFASRSNGANRDTDLPDETKEQLTALGFGTEKGNPISVGIATNTNKRK